MNERLTEKGATQDETRDEVAQFVALVNSVCEKVSSADIILCDEFDLSFDILDVWKSGRSAPGAYVREDVTRRLEELIVEASTQRAIKEEEHG
jgi:hypothetical protein